MPRIAWNPDKNQLLQRTRGVSFEEVAQIIEQDGPLAILMHHNLERYPNQRLYIVAIRGYAYIVPVVETTEELFLKTLIPSRRMTQRYMRKEEEDV